MITLVKILTDVCLCREHFTRSGLNSKLRAIQAVSVLLQGPSDVGNRTLEMSGMMDAVISLCASEDVIHQQVAVEALIHATSKAKRASFITANGVALLKDLYKKSENDRIRVRALVVSDAAISKLFILKKLEDRAFSNQTMLFWHLFFTGSVQAWISRGNRFQHEAVCRRIHAKACQAVQEVCGAALNIDPGERV